MKTMQMAIGVPVGFSDHTLGTIVPTTAVALGACAIEKHYTVNREDPGPDHAASLTGAELTEMVKLIREVESLCGDGIKQVQPCEADVRAIARRSLFLTRDVKAGEIVVESDLICLRPPHYVSPTEIDNIVGKKCTIDMQAGRPFKWADIGQEKK